MEISNKRFALVLLCVALASAGLTYALTPWVLRQHGVTSARANVFFIMERFDGPAVLQVGNVITDIGENYTRCAFSRGGTWSNVTYISIGNATASASLTILTSEYDRQKGTIAEWINGGDYAFNCTYKWTFSATVTINAAGAHWESTGDGNMYAVANFPNGNQTFNANENLTVRWVFTYNAN